MTAPIRYQIIGGIRYRIRDVGVDDLERAAQNRKRVAEGYGNEYWIRLENQLEREERQEMAGIIQVRRK